MIIHIVASKTDDPEIYFQDYIEQGKLGDERLSIQISNIGNKIEYLILENFNIRVSSGKIDTIHLKNCDIVSGEINADYVICDNSFATNEIPKGHVYKQYTYVIKNITKRTQYRLTNGGSSHIIEYKDYEDENYTQIFYAFYPYYDQVESYGFVYIGHYLDLCVDPSFIPEEKFHPLNISFMTIDEFPVLSRQKASNNESKYNFTLTTTGNWSVYNESQKVTFTSYQEYVDVNTDLNSYVNFSRENPYNYKAPTWVPQIYQPFNLTDKSLIYLIIIVEDTFYFYLDEWQKMLDKQLECRWRDCPDKKDFFDYIVDGKCIYKKDLNDTLKNIPKGIDKVYIANCVLDLEIDFRGLPYQVVVKVSSYGWSLNSFWEYFLAEKYPPYPMTNVTFMDGNISEKVSYLIVTSSFINWIDSDLYVHSVQLLYSKILYEYSYAIASHDLVVDLVSHAYIVSRHIKIIVDQYSLIVPNEVIDRNYAIVLNTDNWVIKYLDGKPTSEYYDYKSVNSTYGYIPFSYTQSVGFILYTKNIQFFDRLEENPHKNINITILNETGLDIHKVKYTPIEESIYNLRLVPDSDTKLKVTVTAFHDVITVESSNSSIINLTKEEVFKFNPHPLIIPEQTKMPIPTNLPNTSLIPTKTPVPEIIGELYEPGSVNEIENVDQFNSDLDKSFEKLNENSFEGNQVVVVNANSFPFDKQLNENQYIKPVPNSKINFINGDLNIVFPDDGDVTISLNNNKNVNILLKGNGNVVFESEENEINIKNKADINGTVSIKVPNTVKSVSIDSIDLSNECSIECKSSNENFPISINKINADSTTKTTLNMVTIKETLIIDQMAILELHDVNVKGSKIVYNLYNYINIDPILNGEFADPPSSFDIKLNGQPESIDKIDLISGSFDDNICEQWAAKVNLDFEKFTAKCSDANSRSIKSSKKTLYVDLSPADSPDKGNDGLSGGAIAGIVIAVIAVIAIVVVVVVIIIRKRKDNYKNSSESINEDNDNLQDEV